MIPKPTFQQSIERLTQLEEYRIVLDFVKTCREQFLADLRQAKDPHDVMKLAGSISTLDELIGCISAPKGQDSANE